MVGVAILLAAPDARAQVRYDVGVLGGFAQRFVAGSAAEGGVLMVDAHVAVVPLLRVGAWGSAEVSKPLDDGALRGIFSGGLRAKIVPPWPRGVWRAWVATGFGYDGLVTSDAGGGGFFEVPAIIGASYRIRKPVVFLMELAARIGFGFWGSYYDSHTDGDVIAITLSLGIGVD